MKFKYKISDVHIITIFFGAILLGTFSSSFQQKVFSENTNSTSIPPILTKTDNNSVQISLKWDPSLPTGNEIPFSLEFKHPFNDMNLQHVNYNIELLYDNGTSVYSKENIHTHIGSDIQNIMIPNKGSYKLLFTVLGTGIDPPFDMTRSGSAEVSLQF